MLSKPRWQRIGVLAGIILVFSVAVITISRRFAYTLPFGLFETRPDTLRGQADDFLIGFASVNNFWSRPDAAQYQEIAAREFNFLTPENQLKWSSVHPGRTRYSFDSADRHIAFAQEHGMKLHGHTLVWHSQNPTWLTQRTWTAEELTELMYDHIDTVVGRYRGQIAVWDVVNEAFDEDGSLRKTIWSNNLSKAYIEMAFQRTRAADPDAILLYNDYNIETLNPKSNAVYAMAKDFKERGIPIDGIGFQMHITNAGLNMESFAANMQRFADLGLSIYITEMDVRMRMPPRETSFEKQAQVYAEILDACLRQPACRGLQVWGLTDAVSWVPGFFEGEGAALLYDEAYQPKPAYFALLERLRAED